MTSAPSTSVAAEQLLSIYEYFDRALVAAESVSFIDTATAITNLCVASIPGVEEASISEGRGGKFRTIASTGPMATAGDALQYQLGKGPCVDALQDDVVYLSGDVTADTRWPQFARRVTARCGAVSMLVFRLFFEDDTERVTGLNLYSTQPDAFDDTARTMGTVLATRSAPALITAGARERAANLARALDSNREIGTAMGIIMAGHRVTRDNAFDLLRFESQNSNRKVVDVAREVVETGQLELPLVKPGSRSGHAASN